MRKVLLATSGVVVLAILAGLFAISADEARGAKPAVGKKTVVVRFSYRKTIFTSKFDSKTLTVEIPVAEGPVAEIPRDLPEATGEFAEWRVTVQPGMNSLIIRAFDKKSGKLVLSQLFQTSSDLHNQFYGNHGFTGLNYLYHPESDSELQFYANVK